MPAIVSELNSGRAADVSSDGGQLAVSRTRVWKVLLSHPNESYDIYQAIGTRVGDVHPQDSSVPCVSISERADGESRLVRIVTAEYRTTPGGNNQDDPNSQPPNIRPARYTLSSTVMEVPAYSWREIDSVTLQPIGAMREPVNPVGDRYDGVTKMIPVTTISIDQFDLNPVAGHWMVGSINEDNFSFLGQPVFRYHCMLRGISVRPHVESFGGFTYRGFIRSFDFLWHSGGNQYIAENGFWINQIVSGFNIINDFGDNVDTDALNLRHEAGKVWVVPGIQLAAGTQGTKCRAMVKIPFPGSDGWCQRPSAQPVALNEDGTPRSREANPPVLTKKYIANSSRAFGQNFVGLGVRIAEVI